LLIFSLKSTSLRQDNGIPDQHRALKAQTQECTVTAIADTRLPGLGEVVSLEETFVCEISPEDNDGESGHIREIEGTSAQIEKLRELLYTGELESGFSTLRIPGSEISEGGVILPAGEEITLGHNGRRKLLANTGDRYFLAVRVAALDKVVAATAASISDDIFGTYGDPVNMVSQFVACSYGQLTIIPGPAPGTDISSSLAAPGVIDVTIPIALGTSNRDQVFNAITTAVQTKLGFNLPGPFDAVMYIVEGCYVDCGWAAYAGVNSWYSVYQGVYYSHAAVQVHEIGHNLNLAHSGGLDGAEYTDHTCSVSCYYD
jgi:hypothetical protein